MNKTQLIIQYCRTVEKLRNQTHSPDCEYGIGCWESCSCGLHDEIESACFLLKRILEYK